MGGSPLRIFVFLGGEHLAAPAFIGACHFDGVAVQFLLLYLLESNLCGATAVGAFHSLSPLLNFWRLYFLPLSTLLPLRVKMSHCWSSSPVFLKALRSFFFFLFAISITSLSVIIIAYERGFVNPYFLTFKISGINNQLVIFCHIAQAIGVGDFGVVCRSVPQRIINHQINQCVGVSFH